MAPAPQLTQLLSKLRAPIFNTLPVVSNARTGNKYLRRRLRGPSMVNYVPQLAMPSLPSLNANTPNNQFYGWDGSKRCDAETRANFHLPPELVVAEGCTEVMRLPTPCPPRKGKDAYNPRPAGWLVDGDEYLRFDDVARKKKLGKGPPKKGEGRRSAMGKGKKK